MGFVKLYWSFSHYNDLTDITMWKFTANKTVTDSKDLRLICVL